MVVVGGAYGIEDCTLGMVLAMGVGVFPMTFSKSSKLTKLLIFILLYKYHNEINFL